jgi:ribonuclease BN (tRNA processing enzyme)
MSRPNDAAVRVTVVGSGTAVPDAERVCSGYLLETGSIRLLLDCGPGVVHHLARLGLPWQQITHLALTHFHNDHIGDVPMLFFALRHGMPPGRTQPLKVFGPRGTRALLEGMAAIFGDHIADPGFPVEVLEVQEDEPVGLDETVRITPQRTPHTAVSVAYRIDTPAGAIGYTGDTGYSEEVASFLQSCEILISECSLPDGTEVETHLTPSKLAGMAMIARPRQLVVTHMYPSLEPTTVPARLAQAGWKGQSVLAFDGLTLSPHRSQHT